MLAWHHLKLNPVTNAGSPRVGAGAASRVRRMTTGGWLLGFQKSLFLRQAYGAPFDRLCCARDLHLPPLHHLFSLTKQICQALWCCLAPLSWKKRNSWDEIQSPLEQCRMRTASWSPNRRCWAQPWIIQEDFLWLQFRISF